HLLADDVGGLADPLEHLVVLDDRRDQQPETGTTGPGREARHRGDPTVGVAGQHILHAFGRAERVTVGRHRETLSARSPAPVAYRYAAGTWFSAQVATPHAAATGSRYLGGARYCSRWSYT